MVVCVCVCGDGGVCMCVCVCGPGVRLPEERARRICVRTFVRLLRDRLELWCQLEFVQFLDVTVHGGDAKRWG